MNHTPPLQPLLDGATPRRPSIQADLILDGMAPMRAWETPVGAFSDPGWLFELKYDGCRMLAGVGGDGVSLKAASGADLSRVAPEIVRALVGLEGGPHVFDGELCVLDELGRSDARRLQARLRRRGTYRGADSLVYCIHDLLMFDGVDLRRAPVELRKAGLDALFLMGSPPDVLQVRHFEGSGELLVEQALLLDLPGVIAKRLGSPYRCGECSRDWLPIATWPATRHTAPGR